MPTASISASGDIIKALECRDGYQLQFRAWPAQPSPVATLVLINGAMSHSGWFRELARLLAARGLNVIGADRRGSGLNRQERGDAPSRDVLLSDLGTIINHQERGLPIYLVGWCWGAVLAVNAVLEFGSAVAGLVLLAPGLFPSDRINDAMRSPVVVNETAGVPSMLASPLTEEMFTDIPRFRDLIAADELAVRAFTPRFVQVSRTMMLVAAARVSQINLPVLLLLAAHDQTVNNQKTLRTFQKLGTTNLTSATLSYNHALQLEAPQEVAIHITKWLSRQGISVSVSGDF